MTARNDRKTLKFRIKRLATDYLHPIFLAYPVKTEKGEWALHFLPTDPLSAIALFQESASYALKIEEKRTWVEFTLESTTSSNDELFLDSASRLIFNFYGKNSVSVNQRSTKRGQGRSEFIIRDSGKEVARIVKTGYGATNVQMINGRVRRSDLPEFVELFHNLDQEGAIDLDVVYI